ncbi:MAG: DMT family protein [Leptospira sp.]|nr:DMT family protein [Leptospira sp.]
MLTILLLIFSNLFMTFAWYGHLKFAKTNNLFYVILISWGIAFFEYVLMVPANRIGFTQYKFEGFQLKIIQEIITILVFMVFAVFVLGERIRWNYLVSFGLIILAGYFAFAFAENSKGQ